MSDPSRTPPKAPPQADLLRDEGGLHAPPELGFWRRVWWWFDFLVLVKIARLRFIAILAAIGVVITQWDTLNAYYKKWTRPKLADVAEQSEFEWFCPMHPTVVRDNPKEKCPICFMPLSKRRRGTSADVPLAAGTVNRVQLSPYRVVLAGVRTWPIDYVKLSKTIDTVGYVEFDERRQVTVAARVKGRLDQLLINETGQLVEAGDPLARMYSPDLLVTAQTLLDASRSKTTSFLESSRTRLKLWGIDDAQIDDILRRGEVDPHLTIRSPIGGHVITKYVREGQYVEEGMPLYEVADLSTVWILAQVYEDDASALPLEQATRTDESAAQSLEVHVTTSTSPGEEFPGRLALVYPHVDQNSRTLTVRCEIKNVQHKLRPGGTADVHIRVPVQQIHSLTAHLADDAAIKEYESGRFLAVPQNAVIDTGHQQLVYREAQSGVFEGILVRLGPRLTDDEGVEFFPILSGLVQGDRVVTNGSFLVDAETRLNPAAGSIYSRSGAKDATSTVTTARPTTPVDPQLEINDALAKLSPSDRRLAEAQRVCPIIPDNKLGSMGVPIKLTINGRVVFVCCEGCRRSALKQPEATLKKLESP